MTRQHGYTFIELLAVATTISLLCAIAMPAYFNYKTRAKTLDALNMTAVAKHKISNYYKYTGSFPANNTAAGLKAPEDIRSGLTQSLTVENGAIHVVFSEKDKYLAGKTLSFRPVIVKGSFTSPIHFKCGYSSDTFSDKMTIIGEDKTNVEKTYLPGVCRN